MRYPVSIDELLAQYRELYGCEANEQIDQFIFSICALLNDAYMAGKRDAFTEPLAMEKGSAL